MADMTATRSLNSAITRLEGRQNLPDGNPQCLAHIVGYPVALALGHQCDILRVSE